MNDWHIAAIVVFSIYAFFSLFFFTGGLSIKYDCQDLNNIGIDATHSVRFGFIGVPYNHCNVVLNNVSYSLLTDNIKIYELLENRTK